MNVMYQLQCCIVYLYVGYRAQCQFVFEVDAEWARVETIGYNSQMARDAAASKHTYVTSI